LDSSGFYGLQVQAEQVKELFAQIFGKPLGQVSYYDTPQSRSPKASQNLDEERVRRYLEQRNAILLDRVELVAECLQNIAAKTPETTQRVQTILSAFIKDGNTWETVRAIGIGSKLHGIDLYRLIEPALIGGNTWCRQVALEAVANAPVESSPLRQVGLVLFLHFLKDDLMSSVLGFARQVWERRALLWLVPGFLLLLALSAAVALSPLAFYWPVLKILEQRPAPPAALGMGWPGVAGAIVVACGGIIYFFKYRYKIPVLYFPAWASALLVCASLRGVSDQFAIVLCAVVIVAPQIARTSLSAAGCSIAVVCFGSVRVFRGWLASLREIWSASDSGPLFPWQLFGLSILGFGVLLGVWITIGEWIRLRTGIDIRDWPIIAVGVLFGVLAVAGLIGPARTIAIVLYDAVKALLVRPRVAIGTALRWTKSAISRALKWTKSAVQQAPSTLWALRKTVSARIVGPAVGFAVFVIFMWGLFGMVGLAVEHPDISLHLAKPLVLVFAIVLIAFLTIAVILPNFEASYYEEFGQTLLPISFRRVRFFGFMETEAQRAMNILAQYGEASASARFDAFRTALPGFKQERWQAVLYRQMDRAYKEMRQESGAQADSPLGNRES
jgi:hypothetical protein